MTSVVRVVRKEVFAKRVEDVFVACIHQLQVGLSQRSVELGVASTVVVEPTFTVIGSNVGSSG